MLKSLLCLMFYKCPYCVPSLFINSLSQEQDNMILIPGTTQNTVLGNIPAFRRGNLWQSQIQAGFYVLLEQ